MNLQKKLINDCLTWLSAFALLVSSISTGWAQTLATIDFDITAPVISHEPVSRGVAGEMLTLTASIEDNNSVNSASVFYLTSTAQQYTQLAMSPDESAATWFATIDTNAGDSVVKYYIVAEDLEGNKVQKGGQSNPFVVELSKSEFFLSGPTENYNNNKQPNLLLLALGVIAAGLLLSGGSGGGDNAGTIQSDDTCCRVTFTVENAGGN